MCCIHMLQDNLLIRKLQWHCTAEGTLAQHFSAIISVFPAKKHTIVMDWLLSAIMMQQARQVMADRHAPTPSPIILQLYLCHVVKECV